MAFVQPNLWIVSGGGITVRFTTLGGNSFHYQDSIRTVDVSGSAIRVVNVPDVGTMVSITVFLTIDSGSTTFTLVLPVVNLQSTPLSSAPVTTLGISTAHHFSIVPLFANGQQEFYSTVTLTGTAFNA